MAEKPVKREKKNAKKHEDNIFLAFCELFFSLLYLGFSIAFLYRLTIYRKIDGFSPVVSTVIFWLICIIGWVAETILTVLRSNINMIVMTLGFMTPLAVYTFLSYEETRIRGIIALIIALVVGIGFLLLTKKLNRNEKRALDHFAIADCGKTVGVAVFTLIVFLPMLVSFSIANGSAFSKKVFEHKVSVENRFSDTEIIEENIDDLTGIKKFNALSDSKKLDLLQEVANIEAEYLGIDRPVVSVADLNDGYIWGEYMDGRMVILIDRTHLKEDETVDVFHTLFHEMYHEYIDVLREKYPDAEGDLLFEREMDAYRYEKKNYVSSDEGYDVYKKQLSEIRCNQYADKRVDDYENVMRMHYGYYFW